MEKYLINTEGVLLAFLDAELCSNPPFTSILRQPRKHNVVMCLRSLTGRGLSATQDCFAYFKQISA